MHLVWQEAKGVSFSGLFLSRLGGGAFTCLCPGATCLIIRPRDVFINR